MTAIKILGATLAAAIAAVAALLILGIPGSVMTSAIGERVARDTGYRIKFGGMTRIGLWPAFNVTLTDVTLAEPNGSDSQISIALGRVNATISFANVLSGRMSITDLSISKPVLRVPLLRERTPAITRPAEPSLSPPLPAVDHVTVSDGAVILFNARDRFENRIDDISADARIDANRKITIAGGARAGAQPITFSIDTTMPAAGDRTPMPTNLTLDAPGLRPQKLTAKADVRITGAVLSINSLSGMLGDQAFNGWASADLASKPLVKLDLAIQKLMLGSPDLRTSSGWSDAPIDLTDLNYVDASIRVSFAELGVGDTRLMSPSIEATLASGMLKAQTAKFGLYDGRASGQFAVDVSGATPNYTLRGDVADVRALPLLTALADFDKIDGRMQARFDLRGSGASQRAIVTSLSGNATAAIKDGEILGLNLASMIRSLTSGTGWQGNTTEATDLSELSAAFRIENGQATTSDLSLAGPLVRMTGNGTVNLDSKTLTFRVEPKLAMTLQGQGSTAAPAKLGIPLVVKGPWAEPTIAVDLAGKDGASAANSGASGESLGETLGKLIQQGLGNSAKGTPQGGSPLDDIMKGLFGR